MKRKDRDTLINLTFGELDPEQASRVERVVAEDPKLAEEACSLASMKQALRAMKNVPECQLSIERVRDAILREEMDARRRPERRWGAILAPVAATGLAAVAFLTMQGRGAFKDVGDLPGQGSATVAAETRAAEPAIAELPDVAVDPTEAPRVGAGDGFVARTTPDSSPTVERAPRPRTKPVVEFSSRGSDATDRAAASVAVKLPDGPSAPETDPVATEPDAASEAETVVIIHGESEDETGTRMASEVSPDQHVLIGS